MRRSVLIFAACSGLLSGCVHVKLDPVHVVVDVNVKVDKALDDFFGDLDKKSVTISAPAQP